MGGNDSVCLVYILESLFGVFLKHIYNSNKNINTNDYTNSNSDASYLDMKMNNVPFQKNGRSSYNDIVVETCSILFC